MILRQLAEGRCEVENQYTRVVPYEGNLRALEVHGRGLRAAPALRVARPRLHLPERRCGSPTPTPTSTPSCASRSRACASPTRRRASAARCSRASSSRGSARCSAPPARPSAPIGTCMVSPRGRLRRLLQLRALRARAGGGVTWPSQPRLRPRAADPRDHRDRAREARRSSATRSITMAHGAGGKATQTLIEGLLVPAFALARARRARRRRRSSRVDGARARADHRHASSSSRSASPAARSASSPSTAPSTTSPWRARGRSRSRLSLVLEEGLPADELRAEVEAIAARRARRRASQIVAGDTKVVERGHADGCTSARPASARVDPRATLSPAGAAARRPRSSSPGSIGEHGTAIMLARGEFELDARDRVRHPLAVAGGRRAARRAGPGAALPARRHPRRRRVGAQRARARVGRGDDRARGRRAGRTRRSRAPPRSSASTRCTSPTRASSSPFVAPEARRRRARRAARGAGLRAGGGDRRGADRAARDGAGRDRVRRPAGDGPARRRPAAEDLLRTVHELSIAEAVVRIASAHAARPPGGAGRAEGRPPAPGRARRRSRSPSSWWPRARRVEGAELVMEEVPAAGRCRAAGPRARCRRLPAALPALRRAGRGGAPGRGAAGRRARARGGSADRRMEGWADGD